MTQTTSTDSVDHLSIHPQPKPGPEPGAVNPSSLAAGLLRTARPKQWAKNVLVFAAPAAGGALTHAHVLVTAAETFVVFTLAAIATYFVNDAADVHHDRLHPKKRHRPIAAGIVPVPLAWAVAAAFLIASLALAVAVQGTHLAGVIFGYVVLTLSYSFWLKRQAVVELACVAAGFVLRMIAGGVATHLPISSWFLTVASFSSLFVVAGKRYGEVMEMGEGQSASRPVLAQYTVGFLRAVWGMAMAVSSAVYCQWAFERAAVAIHPIWYQLSAVPWVLGLLRYGLLLEKGHGAAPEDVLLSDRVLLVMGAVWIGLFAVGIYDHQ